MIGLPSLLLIGVLMLEDSLPLIPARLELAARLAALRVRRALRRQGEEARRAWAEVDRELVATGDPRLRAAWWWGVAKMHALGVE
jgi:hypothetical protein